jgi:hypothetical protein
MIPVKNEIAMAEAIRELLTDKKKYNYYAKNLSFDPNTFR